MKKTLTIFTPTYNRAHLLPRLYESLCVQTVNDFEWLIIDDGSTDETAELVMKWQQENKIDIQYYFQENGGMLAAHENAYSKIESLLCTCIDSDDWMPENGVEIIVNAWEKYGDENCCGLIGLDDYADGKIVGTQFPSSPWKCRFIDFFSNGVVGDKKFVHRVEIIKKFLPYPKFGDERFRVTSYLYYFMGEEYHYYAVNEVFCTVEYQEDGLSKNIINQYRESPRSFAQFRLAAMKFMPRWKDKLRHAIHLNSSMLMANDFSFFSKSPHPLLTTLSFPMGILLYFYLRFTPKTSVNKKLNQS